MYLTKTLRAMQLTAIFLLATILHVCAKGVSQTVTFSGKDVPLQKVFTAIEQQTGVVFFYEDQLLQKTRPVTIKMKNTRLDLFLKNLLADQPLDFVIKGETVFIRARENPATHFKPALNNPPPITGIVRGPDGQPLAGVNVMVKGTNKGVSTQNDGRFTIDAAIGDVLIISSIGYGTKEIKVNDETEISIGLELSTLPMDEVQIVAYGKTRKKDQTGAVSSLNVSDMAKTPVARIDQALQGHIAGAQIVQNSGEPGSPISFYIRGAGTIGNTDPLFVVDGIPTKVNISTLNMSDIESISVLKDAAAAAMYGSRAANGVVLINTKSGKSGKSTIDFDAYYGIQEAWKKIDLLDASQWAGVRNTALANDGLPPVWDNIDSLGKGTDWQDVMFRAAPIQNYNISASGGNDKTRYFLSAGHFKQDGIIHYSDYVRNSVRANIHSSPTNRLNFGSNFTFSVIDQNIIPTQIAGALKNAILTLPVIPVYREGRFAGPRTPREGTGGNPLAQAANANNTDLMRRLTYRGFGEYEIFKNLKIKTSLGIDNIEQEHKTFTPTYAYDNNINTVSQLSQNNSNMLDWIWENTLTYKASFANNQSITALAGTSAQQSKRKYTNILKTNFPGNDPNLRYLDNGSEALASNIDGNIEEWSLVSYFGRADYNFDDKYLLSANVRVDGSSRFGASNRYGVFPSFALGWNIIEENFMKNVDFVSHLKLRASWGQLGNQDIGLYSFASILNPYYTTFGQTPTAAPGYAPGSPPNTAVKWETTTQTDIGLELSVLQSRLSFEMDYYVKKTDDMLLQLPTPLSTGYGSTSFTNAGSVKNSGWEFSATYRKMKGTFNYSISANLSTYKNEVLNLGPVNQPVVNGLFFDFASSSNVGNSLYHFFGYEMEGIFQTQDEINKHASQPGARPGDVKFKDIDNNGMINANDRTFVGNPFPKMTYGVNTNLSYKNFDCFIQLQGTQGNKIFNAARFWGLNVGENINYSTEVLKSWNGEGTSNEVPRLSTQDPNNNRRAVTRFIEDGSYMRIKNVQVGYTLPTKLINRIKLRNLRMYIGANNLLTITKYTGFDPEVGAALGRGSIGFDQVSFPQARTITFGLQLGIL